MLRIALEVVREPMLLLLVGGGTIYLAIGDLYEALILLVSVFVVMGITIYQERKTERALEALRDLSSPRALVVRAGEEKRIAGHEVVPGDLVLLHEGDRVPADGVLVEFHTAKRPNYQLMLDIISYLQDYSDEVHHPREDVAYARLAKRCPAIELTLVRFGQEHRVIAHAGKSLLNLLNEILGGTIALRAELETAAATYLESTGTILPRRRRTS